MAITLSQNPGTINQAYGVNAVSLSGITSEDKYVVRVKNQAGDIVADVRQTPNKYGQAIFDIQNILQTYVKPGDADIDNIGVNSTDRYRNSFNLGFKYDIEYGTETGGIFTSAGTVEDLEVYPGRKEYYEINWPISTYTADIIEVSGEIILEQQGQGLTDNPTITDNTLLEGSQITGCEAAGPIYSVQASYQNYDNFWQSLEQGLPFLEDAQIIDTNFINETGYVTFVPTQDISVDIYFNMTLKNLIDQSIIDQEIAQFDIWDIHAGGIYLATKEFFPNYDIPVYKIDLDFNRTIEEEYTISRKFTLQLTAGEEYIFEWLGNSYTDAVNPAAEWRELKFEMWLEGTKEEDLVVDVYSTELQGFDPDPDTPFGKSPLSCPNIVLNDGGWRQPPAANFYQPPVAGTFKIVMEGQVQVLSSNPGDVFPAPFHIQKEQDPNPDNFILPDVINWPLSDPLPTAGVPITFRLEWNNLQLNNKNRFSLFLFKDQFGGEAAIQTLPDTNVKIYKLAEDGGGGGGLVEFKAYEQTVRPDDRVTISYLQNVNVLAGSAPESRGISAFTVVTFDESGNLLSENTYPNLLSEGGGPYATQGEAVTPSYPYAYMTFGAGPANLADSIDFSQVAYYYVLPQIYDSNCITNLFTTPLWYGHKFTIDRGICLDFEPIQFSWMNSLGTRDYYTFTKKNERSVRIKRDTYLKSAADYNGVTYQVEPEDRGTTTYSQQLDQEYIANTDYISDLDAEWMESLFVSPDVRVRFSGQTQWFPVTLTSSSYTQKTFKKDRLFQYEVRFKLAHGIKSQRG